MVRLARLEERTRALEAELISARQRIHALGNFINQRQLAAMSPDESTPTLIKHPRRRASEGSLAMTTVRLFTYALGIVAAVAAFLVPHPQAQLVLLPVATGLLGLATNGPWMQKPLDNGK